ncbi:MAG: hypothetical protein ACLFVZ_11575, partial [Actinomycetota bacterium]
MITPDGTSSEKPKRTPGRAVLLGVAALVVFAGLVILGNLTTPDPAAVEDSTTSTADDLDPPVDNFT